MTICIEAFSDYLLARCSELF